MSKIRVVLADDHPVVRLGVRTALEREPDLEVVGEAADGIEAVLLVERIEPDVLILDVRMPEMDGISAARHVRVNNPDVRILVLSAHDDEENVSEMLAAGVYGYLLKDDALEYLVQAVRTVARSQTWLTPKIMNTVARRFAGEAPGASPAAELMTTRELEVLHRIAQGRTNQEIATSLSITERTVRYHVANIFAKLHVTSRIEAVIEALRQGFVKV